MNIGLFYLIMCLFAFWKLCEMNTLETVWVFQRLHEKVSCWSSSWLHMLQLGASESKCELPSTGPQAPTSWHLNGIKRLWTVIVFCCNSTGFYVRWLRLQRSRSSSSSALPAENWSTLLLDVTVECIPSTPTAFPYLFLKNLFRLSDSNKSVTHKTLSFAQPYFVFLLNENLFFSIFRRNWRQFI